MVTANGRKGDGRIRTERGAGEGRRGGQQNPVQSQSAFQPGNFLSVYFVVSILHWACTYARPHLRNTPSLAEHRVQARTPTCHRLVSF